jgi:polysaccharide deacetylase family protein (PEP-CTERM system associated)
MSIPAAKHLPDAPSTPVETTHLLTVAVEDYFHATALDGIVLEKYWQRMESRVAANTDRTLGLLDEYCIKATFFVLGWVAERMPEVVEAIAKAGHEIACKSYIPRTIGEMSPNEFRDDLRRTRSAAEKASGRQIFGYRVARGSFGTKDLWALDILAEGGFAYDSSIYPHFRSIAEQPWRRFPHPHHGKKRDIFEFPLSSCGPSGFLFPAAGGNYLRQIPPTIMRQAFAYWHRAYDSPFNMYFHVWELDPDLPRLSSMPLLTRIRQYRNLAKMPKLLRYYFERYAFQGIASMMGLEQVSRGKGEPETEGVAAVFSRSHFLHERSESIPVASLHIDQDATPVTVVVPCYNEEPVLSYLCNTLQELRRQIGGRYQLQFIFVDDGSSDNTWQILVDAFSSDAACAVLRHDQNRGVAAAIMTGIRAATTEIVCSIDCDCSYDPRQLEKMLPLLADDVALVTASPYHEEGTVLNVPAWRLFLSKSLSRLYRLVLKNKIATETSCFRVYRRSKVAGCDLRHENFLGIAELLGVIDLRGEKIVEYPAILESRLLGYSKMKTLSTIVGHIGLLGRFALQRRLPGRSCSGPTKQKSEKEAKHTPDRLDAKVRP